MNILTIAMGIFVCLELMNVAMLYFTPGARRGNGIGVFNAWEKSKENDEVHWRPYNSTVCRGGDDTIHTHVFLEAVSDDTAHGS